MADTPSLDQQLVTLAMLGKRLGSYATTQSVFDATASLRDTLVSQQATLSAQRQQLDAQNKVIANQGAALSREQSARSAQAAQIATLQAQVATLARSGGAKMPADTTPPTSPTIIITDSTSSSVSINISGGSDTSGVTQYRAQVDGGGWQITNGPIMFTGLSASSSHTITAQAGDASGNWSSSTSVQAQTSAAPVVTPTATVVANDVGSGVLALSGSGVSESSGVITLDGPNVSESAGVITIS